MKFVEYADRDMMALQVANVLAGDLEHALFTHDTVTLAVPGGSTPGPIFDALSGVRLPWDRVIVMPTDERWVPHGHERSNARLIRSRLVTDRAEDARFVTFYRDGLSPENAVPQINEALAPHLPVSVLVLGMGDDMHTASLFPGAPGLAEALAHTAPPVAVIRPEVQPEARITLTAPVLDGALSKHLLITGTDKRIALERAQSRPPEEAPVQAVLSDVTVHWAE